MIRDIDSRSNLSGKILVVVGFVENTDIVSEDLSDALVCVTARAEFSWTLLGYVHWPTGRRTEKPSTHASNSRRTMPTS
jgi:hypothetical protein